MRSTLAIALLSLALIPLAAGCGDDSGPAQTGDLQVTYRVGSGSSDCQDVGIAFVRVYVGISDTKDLVDRIFPCQPEAQSVTMTDIEVGTYTIRVEGLDSANNIIYSGKASAPTSIVADQTNGPITVVLNQRRPTLEIFFGFNDVGGCERFEVKDIVVRLYENGASLIHDQIYDCALQISSSLIIENLSETSTFDLRVRGRNAFQEGTFEYNQDGITVAAGAATTISAKLKACTGLCSEP